MIFLQHSFGRFSNCIFRDEPQLIATMELQAGVARESYPYKLIKIQPLLLIAHTILDDNVVDIADSSNGDSNQ